MSKTINSREAGHDWQAIHEATAPQVGGAAPDFTLWDSSGSQRLRLADFKGKKPVALVFGSFT